MKKNHVHVEEEYNMGCCSSRNVKFKADIKDDIVYDWWNAINVKIHIVCVSSEEIRILYRNMAALRLYGPHDVSLFENGVLRGIKQRVLLEGKVWKGYTRHSDTAPLPDRSHSSSAMSTDYSMMSGSESMDSLVANTWFELRAYPLNKQEVLVLQFNINRQMDYIQTLASFADVNLDLMQSLFPHKFKKGHVLSAEYLQNYRQLLGRGRSAFAQYYDHVGVMTVKVCGLEHMFRQITPGLVTEYLSSLFEELGVLIRAHHDLHAYEDSTDQFMILSGLLAKDEKEATAAFHRLLCVALQMHDVAGEYLSPICRPSLLSITLHFGRVMSGVIGVVHPKFTFIGPTMDESVQLQHMYASSNKSIVLSSTAHDQLAKYNLLCKPDAWVKQEGDHAYVLTCNDSTDSGPCNL